MNNILMYVMYVHTQEQIYPSIFKQEPMFMN